MYKSNATKMILSIVLFLSFNSIYALSTPSKTTKPPFQLQKIDHVVLRCRDFQRMFYFYTTVLGCTVDEVGRFGGALTHLRAGDAFIDLLAYDPSYLTSEGKKALAKMHGGGKGLPPSFDSKESADVSDMIFDPGASTLDHLCLRVDPFDESALLKFMANEGVKVLASGERKGAEGIGPSLYIEDPEGNVIELKGALVRQPQIYSPETGGQNQMKDEETILEPKVEKMRDIVDFYEDLKVKRMRDTVSPYQDPKVEKMRDTVNPYQGPMADVVRDTVKPYRSDLNPQEKAKMDKSQEEKKKRNGGAFKLTPCTRICRYNADFYGGQVCIGCFRDGFEIENWNKMAPSERYFALLDASERRPENNKFEGSVTKEELIEQAESWSDRFQAEGSRWSKR